MYYYDPDRNQVELLVDNFETAIEGQNYMRRRSATDKNPVGIDFDPEELVKKIQTGLKLEELQTINAELNGAAHTARLGSRRDRFSGTTLVPTAAECAAWRAASSAVANSFILKGFLRNTMLGGKGSPSACASAYPVISTIGSP